MYIKMLDDFMKKYHSRAALLISALALLLGGVACQKVPLLAPSGSTLTLSAGATALPPNGSTTIVAQVIEPAGTPPHSGTNISFSTTLGTVQPSNAETDINGQARVTFVAGAINGTATVTAISGGVSVGTNGGLKIAVGAAAVGRVAVNASPSLVSAQGGQSVITANVLDINGNPLPSVAVSFSTTAGALSSTLVNTDQNGVATTALQTSNQATVTATVGATAAPAPTPPATGGGTGTGGGGGTTTTGTASGSVVVGILGTPALAITPPTSPPSVGLPATFTFAVTAATTNASSVRDVTVSWGDGTQSNLGAITGSNAVSHVYNTANNFNVVATVTDSAGTSVQVSTTVTVIATPTPTVIITPSVPATSGGATTTVSFQLQVTPPSGVGIVNAVLNFGDGQSAQLGGLNGTTTVQHGYTQKGPATVSLTVTDTLGRTTQGTATINVP
jgi:Big-like domain-containing protein/PKD domain-containing protein